MEIVLVQLTDEACEIAVFEMLREDGFGKLFILYRIEQLASPVRTLEGAWHLQHDKAVSFVAPAYGLRICRVLQHSGPLLERPFTHGSHCAFGKSILVELANLEDVSGRS